MGNPRSTAELAKQATVSVDPNQAIRFYFRSADQILKQARVYRLEHDLEHAYIFYMKYTNLGISELRKHPQYKHAENKANLRVMNKNCLEALELLEQMKPVLNDAYDAHVKKIKEAQELEKATSITNQTTQWQSQQRSIDVSNPSKEWSLQDALKGVPGVGYGEGERTSTTSHHQTKADYPSLSLHNQSDGFVYQPKLGYQQTFIQPPQLPPKISYQPSLPPKVPLDRPRDIRAPELPPKIKLDNNESVHRSGVTTDASTERGEPLRKLLLPKGLQSKFLSIAGNNTRNKIETCGILAGTLKNNILKITTLIIPKQTGTPDTCTTENEEDLFDIQDKHDLLTFGWIHTHPTQSCFLSSVDLHTHCSYQLMLPEAIAIVCAPAHNPNFGIFRLTDPPGLDVISNCKKTPAFHPHPDLPIYTGADEEGHVSVSDYDFIVLDVRDKK
ncbi:hypothetical protein MFLAVUS_001274 [Mucor flavus]|uniref:MPN domain-containing protein n=1 Tax=Mucor flavus TaxID=439312 RepID=A0ABP9YM08_9FUNG